VPLFSDMYYPYRIYAYNKYKHRLTCSCFIFVGFALLLTAFANLVSAIPHTKEDRQNWTNDYVEVNSKVAVGNE
jgi:hypothetical protein